MKRILITGANSYIGTSLKKWLMKEPEKYYVDTLDMTNPTWKEKNFSFFDVVFHVAGIAHVSSKKKKASLYFKINRDLAIHTAIKAKEEGVNQFIFMSSIIIYGKDNKIGDYSHINTDKFLPENAYGQSKYEADQVIQQYSSPYFITSIIRSPMVYGPGCKGNFLKLVKAAMKLPIIPNIYNQRSMIYIDNLCELVRLIIDYNEGGVFYPQNSEYVSTTKLIEDIRHIRGKKIKKSKILVPIFRFLSLVFPVINKIFGNKTYINELSQHFHNNYILYNYNESLIMTMESINQNN